NTDARFLENLNEVFRHAASLHDPGPPTQEALFDWLEAMGEKLHAAGGAFENVDQFRNVVRIVRHHFLADYRQFHRDLLWHRGDHELWRPFMLGRVFEIVLQQGPPWGETDRITADARDQLDDY